MSIRADYSIILQIFSETSLNNLFLQSKRRIESLLLQILTQFKLQGAGSFG